MVKSYLKFEPSKTFGQICSAASNVVWDPRNDHSISASKASVAGAGHAIVGANEDVLVWDVKKGELVERWHVDDNNAQVTVITKCAPAPELYAVGYNDGRIRVWDSVTATVVITFNGHKSGITQLVFNRSGGRLASGSKDTDIILWDLVAEVGIFRLRGHKDQITSLHFLSPSADNPEQGATSTEPEDRFLLSAGKDALIKVWDLTSQHCVETQVAQTNGECWALGLSPDGIGCVSAGNDGELKAWAVNLPSPTSIVTNGTGTHHKVLHDRGVFYRQGRDRPLGVIFHPSRDLVAIHGSEKSIEIFKVRSEVEVRRAMTRKKKRKRDKVVEEDPDADEKMQDENTEMSTAPVNEVIVPYVIVRTGGKVRSIDWAGTKSGKSISMLVSTTNNQLEVFEVVALEKVKKNTGFPDYNRTMSVDMPGHRSDIRCLALSSDDRMLASASHGSLKIWNARTQSCLRTLDCGYALCGTFLPGDKIVVLGTREGTLELFDIASSTLIDTVQAHEKDIWALKVSPDGKSLITGSADKSAKFWEFKVIQEEVLGTTRKTAKLTLVHTRTLKVADDILALCISPDSRLLAVSTLDNTIKVFFVDTLKLYLTLYGHKLPVLSISIAYDSKLLISSSADKNVRIWGLDFGDCHKTLFAHNDSILNVGFVPTNADGNGHHFFSSSKDGTIKYFDGDKFEQIQKLNGHHSEIWAMAVANSGQFLATASHDKSIRTWTQTDEQIFLEEEREKELEELYESTLLTSLENDERADPSTLEDAVTDPSKQTSQTLMAGEKIAEALTLATEDLDIMREHEKLQKANPQAKIGMPQRSPIFTIPNPISASAYVLQTFERIPAASLLDALLVLSFSQLPSLFTFLAIWAEEGRNISLTVRVLLFMLKTHQKQIVSSRLMRNELEEIKAKLRGTLNVKREEVGFNLAGLRILGRRIEEVEEDKGWIDDIEVDEIEEVKAKNKQGVKRTFVNVA